MVRVQILTPTYIPRVDTASAVTASASKLAEIVPAIELPQTFKITNVIDALRYAATRTNEGVVAYPSDTSGANVGHLLYKDLLSEAEANASLLQRLAPGKVKHGSIVIVHFNEALDSIIWYWSVLLAGAVPCMAGPGMFSQDPVAQQQHLEHLNKTLNNPLCLTRRLLLGPFKEQTGTGYQRVQTLILEDIDAVKAILSNLNGPTPTTTLSQPSQEDLAALMLTSGSSGNAKAVQLTHRQILAACRGKTLAANLSFPYSRRPFLSWVHIDHVANFVQCHIMAIVNSVSQVQVPASNVVVDPCQLLNLISRHRVARTFAPNFLLAKLRRQLEADAGQTACNLDPDLNLEGLYLDTGGEANVTAVCAALQPLLSRYGAPRDVFKPGFGMTETCAGCIFNSHCPSYDHAERLEFTSLGDCMPGVQMRIRLLDACDPGARAIARPGERGALELKGDVVFQGYFNNLIATAEAFTSDGWFRTGDLAYLDKHGCLHLDGRTKEVININGVKHLPHELDSALEQAEIPGATPSYFCCFGTRDSSMDTQVVAVLYLPSYAETDDQARSETQNSIVRTVSLYTQSQPRVVPLRVEDLPKSTLGKLSRGKLKTALEGGNFTVQEELNDTAIKRYRQKTRGEVESQEEEIILGIVRKQLQIPSDADFAVNDSLLSTGATSMDLVAVMRIINNHKDLKLSRPVRLIDLLANPTIKAISNLCTTTSSTIDKHEYDPIVPLQSHGSKAPLWLVHPGVGEVLVFINLAHRITDRPIYALRAKGFNADSGETPFQSLDEVFKTYYKAIKQRQPTGPYAIAGYSFGGMIAFEISKRLEEGGDEVRYCGSWNLPPHIKTRMQELVWHECVHHLFYFIGLLDEETGNSHKAALCRFEKEGRRMEGIRYLREHCDHQRWDELGLSEEYYLNWVDLATKMQGMAADYEPSGSVKCMDIFVADPLSHVAKNRQDWVENKLSAWKDFVREEVRFHDVQGAHYTMLDPEYVAGFGETLRRALKERAI